MTAVRRDGAARLIISVLCVGMLAAGVALVGLWHQARQTRALITQQRDAISDLNHALEEAQQGESELRRLVRGLQAQVRECHRHPARCGPPLTQAPTTQTPPETSGQTTATASASRPAIRPSARPTTTPRPKPTSSPQPTPPPSHSPTPSPSVCPIDHICLPPGGA